MLVYPIEVKMDTDVGVAKVCVVSAVVVTSSGGWLKVTATFALLLVVRAADAACLFAKNVIMVWLNSTLGLL
jgi:hypothetical protein